MNTIEKLNQLAEMYARRDAERLAYEELRNKIIPQEIKEQLAEIDAEYAGSQEAVNNNIQALETEIKTEVASVGSSVKGDHIQAVYTKGRVSWDTKALDGYATAHPEIAQFRKVGEPSVAIRK